MKCWTVLALLGLFLHSAVVHGEGIAPNPFFAFDNGVGRGALSPVQQAELLAELGYDGIGYTGFEELDARRAAFDAQGLRIFNLYEGFHLDKNPAYDPAWKDAIAALEGTDIALWLTIQGGTPGQDDARAVTVLREIADIAAAAGLSVALYPHYGFYVADVADALRIAEQSERENVGVTFNLCHELRAGNEARFDALLEAAAPRLHFVSINGADHEGNWDRLIQPLGRGDFDVFSLLKKLDALVYRGPIGLQCYNVQGDTRANLAESMAAWRRYVARLRP